MASDELRAFYDRYLAACNAHDFGQLGDFVVADVEVNDEAVGLVGYRGGLEDLVRAFPDFSWTIRHQLIDGDLLAVHLADHGTHGARFQGVEAAGRTVATAEFAVYRIRDGKIAQVWGTADNLDIVRRLTQGSSPPDGPGY